MIDLDIKKQEGDFSLDISLKTDQKVLGILGQSGSGKTMLLRSIAGLVDPDQGYIRVEREFFNSYKNLSLDPGQRKIGYLFQSYGLFPHMTAEENLSFISKDKEKIKRLLGKVGLEDKKDLYPSQLSGGQKQRLAMARMLATDPELILLDEPFSALDSILRQEMEDFMKDLIKGLDLPAILVSHNREEVYRFCQDVLVIGDGKVEDMGPKERVFTQPKTPYTARLVGFDLVLGQKYQEGFDFVDKPSYTIAIRSRDLEITKGSDFYVKVKYEGLTCKSYNIVNKKTGLSFRLSSDEDLKEGESLGLRVYYFVKL